MIQKVVSLFFNRKNDNDIFKDNCVERESKGCLRCLDGFYLSNSICHPCNYPCTFCSNSTYCTKCDQYSYASNGKCTEINEIINVCDVMMSTYKGCVVCKNGYMRSPDGKTCEICDQSCETCSNDGNCISCNESYYRTPNNITKYCNPIEEPSNCFNKTKNGCVLCEDGFALKYNLCYKCGENCSSCDTNFECLRCEVYNILVDKKCIHFSHIPNCISSENSVCSRCSNEYKLSDDKIECTKKLNYGLVIVLPVVCVMVILFMTVVIITVALLLLFKRKEDLLVENVCVFEMSRSNMSMTKLNGEVLSNKKEIQFGDENENIKIERESRELICVGNHGKGNLKIQITTKDNCDKYTIRTEPKLVTLKSGYACEFEVFLTPLCTINLSDEIVLISLNLKTGKKETTSIRISAHTENSTRIDYDELIEEKKLGEGSFGIVYKGKYRGSIVAIKKMKQKTQDDAEQIVELRKEVEMLDKFRNDYIVHFYGAVFITKKECIVTEFAQYGSLKDILKSKRSDEIKMKIRVKMVLDASKGILYLHENDILHRDIKPDNYLVFSLDWMKE
ncbi:protein serine/threonine kinase, putative [Entamoeba invadens IP1]|uniref:protein serine/threonine kinase, putative n=1 Tax=Entamoeba invadens IP1 TaxID=370355 RepID=UPI0002C3DCA0|nr:protein serine/threonine kinase, putative [Entamoeba invadens IP1]ELP90451.1 protein serine/threonine kinase, putative [Entamoeba invadens IP1]|eukprot:XP_004257222.1 protein serine/threonine kinase, putative [Entamoeba invadens IP1]